MKKEWYVVSTISGHEYKVKEKLENRINSMELHDNIFRVIVPEQKEIEYKDGVKKEKIKKMFPSYVLVEMVMSDEAWFIVRNTQGVTGFIGSSGKGAKPIPLLPQEVDKILGSMGMSRIDISKDLQVGRKVKIVDGPFKDMEAKIDSIDLKEQKLNVLVDLFGNKMTDETKPSNGNRVFFDKTPATIKLNGTEEPITIEAGSEYVDAGATVTDNIDGFISSNYQFTYANYYADPNSDKVTESRLTEIDTRKTGLYKIAYIYTDKAGNTKQATRYLYIKDTTMPTVTLNGEENITIEAGTPYKDEGAKVTDNSDPTIENFKYTNINYYVNGELKKSHLTEVDVKQPGEYKIGYEYTDKSGNTKITVRTVIVKDTTAPVITANGKSQTLKVGDTYTELGATLTDNAYIDADDYEITIHFYDENGKLVYPSPSKVDTSKVGEYRIAYTAKDSSGNASNVATISVKVER